MKILQMLRTGAHVLQTHAARQWGGPSPGPLFVYLMATEACNLKCRFCDLWRTQHRSEGALANELTTHEMLGLVDELSKMGCMIVNVWGGEPLLRADLCEIVRAIGQAGMASVVTTNGLLVTETAARDLVAAGVGSVFVSLDSPVPADHNALRGGQGIYKRAVQGLKRLREAGGSSISVGINVLVNRRNSHQLYQMVRLAEHLSVDSVRFLSLELGLPFSKYSATDRSLFDFDDQALRDLRVELRKAARAAEAANINCNLRAYLRGMPAYYAGKYRPKACFAGDLICDIDARGNVAPCLTVGRMIGNVRERPFREIWTSEEFHRLRRDARRLRCPLCWQSCYIEPSKIVSPFFFLRRLPRIVRLWRLYHR